MESIRKLIVLLNRKRFDHLESGLQFRECLLQEMPHMGFQAFSVASGCLQVARCVIALAVHDGNHNVQRIPNYTLIKTEHCFSTSFSDVFLSSQYSNYVEQGQFRDTKQLSATHVGGHINADVNKG